MHNEGSFSGSTFFCMKGLTPHSKSSGGDTSPHNKVLIFSGENDTRQLLKTLLELWGYKIVVSDCLDDSVPVVQDQNPDLILVDSVLPFETHLKSIRQIRKTEFLKEIPIIVLSGFSQPQFKNLSMACGANGFLVKPLDFDLLEKYLERYLTRHFGKTH